MCTKGKCYYGLVPSLIVTCFSPVVLAQEPPANAQPILNIVLVELNTAPDPKLKEPVVNDWPYWTRSAGKVIESLESVLGYVRAGQSVKDVDASLFAVQATAKGLDDARGLAPLIGKLEHICQATDRPSLLLVWLSREAVVFATVHDNAQVKAAEAFVVLGSLHAASGPGTDMLTGVASPYVVPPVVLASPRLSWAPGPQTPSLDAILQLHGDRDILLHCLRGVTAELIVRSAIKSLSEGDPAGATFKALIGPQGQNINKTALTIADSLTLKLPHVDVSLGPLFRAWDRVTYEVPYAFFSTTGNLGSKWGGVLFRPELVLVVDQSGLTSELKQKAVAAVRDKPAGEFQHEGKRKWAARAPGTAGLFRVPTGVLHLHYRDLTVRGEGSNVVRLERFYDSSAVADSSLGPGWSVEPFALEISRRLAIKGAKTDVALKPVLIDRRTGVRLPYRLDTGTTAAPRPSDSLTVASYRKVSSSLQPDLTARADGGYLASFAHGFQIAFDRAGQIEWMGRGEVDRVTYVHASPLLKDIRGAEASIILEYDNHGRLRGARTSSGQSSAYVLDDAGRLKSVSGSESGNFMFTYGADNRLATVALGTKNLTTNTYDDKGRMLTHRTPQGRWRFAYDDRIGRMTVSGPDGKVTDYYYDAQRRLAAYGAAKDRMTLFNYDVSGRILQVAMAELLNDPSRGELPRFKVSEMVTPLPDEGVSTTKEP